FPEDPIVGEEDAGILRDNPDICRQVSDLVNEHTDAVTESRMLEVLDFGSRDTDFTKRFWTADPIDGTKGFLRGDQYAVALALVENGQIVIGILGCPNFQADDRQPDEGKGYLLYAVRGEGAFMMPLKGGDRKRISVDALTSAEKARFCESVESAHTSHGTHKRISDTLGITSPPYRIDSQAKYAAVACGSASIYLRLPGNKEYREKIWDHAAGAVIVSEAGGQVTDFGGKALDFSISRKLEGNTGILATNGHLHQQVLRAISEVV
ncbi:3'(2'),5'-bisphosphate nucleotidase, partial [Desulfobacterales bacterium HSG2]|nr:3'(2'),5'-bisphosphate nucleotidase [Desulfobacterales bacterium HSG2]